MTRIVLALLAVAACCSSAIAQLTIEITEGRDNPAAIAIVPFSWPQAGVPKDDVGRVVEANLERTGQFEAVPREDMLGTPHEAKEVYYRDWRQLKVDYLLVGKWLEAEGRLMAQYQLFDVNTQKQLLTGRKFGSLETLRDVAHAISDDVYQKLTGIRGAFSTKLLYVSAIKRAEGEYTYRLLTSDADGHRERVLLSQSQPIMTPSWAPDGETIAYVSFETSRPAIFTHNLATNKRTQMTNFRGLNSSPAWSPDGRKLAMVLSKDGSPDVYVMDVATRKLRRITRHFAIDTEPSWMEDGKSIIFTSDRGGKPQIYKVNLATGYEERVTFKGEYNARARVVPDGGGIIMVHQIDGDYHIALQNLERGTIDVLTKTSLDESPSIAPNGAMLLYATKRRNKGILAAVSLDGSGMKYALPSKFGDVREPAWSPYMQ